MKTITIKKPKIRIPIAKPSIRHKSKKDYKRKKSIVKEYELILDLIEEEKKK